MEGRKGQGRARGIREWKGGEGRASGRGILLQGLRGIDAPDQIDYKPTSHAVELVGYII